MEHEGLQAELYIGGVYLTLFMKNPQFPLRNPKASREVAVLDRAQAVWQSLSQPAPQCTQLRTASAARQVSLLSPACLTARTFSNLCCVNSAACILGRPAGCQQSTELCCRSSHDSCFSSASASNFCRRVTPSTYSRAPHCAAVQLFMSHVLFQLLQAFLEGLLDAYCKQLQQAGGSHTAPAGLAVLLAAAAVELLRGHGLLADHAVKLGYIDKLMKVLAARVPARPAGESAC